MWQAFEVGPPIRQNPPFARGECSTASGMQLNPVAFFQNQIGAVVLPLVSDCHKLIWVDAAQIDPRPNGAALLDKTFDAFPYLTPTLTASLARRCSLPLDQVRAWFMLQRLRHGISWDCADISKVRKRIRSGWGTAVGRRTDSGESEEKEPDGRKAREVREDPGTSGGRAADESARDDELLPGEIKDGQRAQEGRGGGARGGQRKTQEKRQRTAATGKRRAERGKRRAERGVVEGAEDEESTSDTAPVASGESKRRRSASNGGPTDGPLPRRRKKTEEQLVMMRIAFLNCEYPDGDDYDHLARLSGVSHLELVQWFCDMRYYVKKKVPTWMTREQHRRALVNIRDRQRLTSHRPRKLPDVTDEAGRGLRAAESLSA